MQNPAKSLILSTKSPKLQSKPKLKESHQMPKYNLPVYTIKSKKIPKPTTEISPYFYSLNNSKFKSTDEGVKPYLKFVKNITITYPIMIPARENIKLHDSIKKSQKQKEKSRDLNSNRNLKMFTAKPIEVTTIMKPSIAATKERTTGN